MQQQQHPLGTFSWCCCCCCCWQGIRLLIGGAKCNDVLVEYVCVIQRSNPTSTLSLSLGLLCLWIYFFFRLLATSFESISFALSLSCQHSRTFPTSKSTATSIQTCNLSLPISPFSWLLLLALNRFLFNGSLVVVASMAGLVVTAFFFFLNPHLSWETATTTTTAAKRFVDSIDKSWTESCYLHSPVVAVLCVVGQLNTPNTLLSGVCNSRL